MGNKNLIAIGQQMSVLHQKKWIRFRLIGLFCIAFLFQHFSYANLLPNFASNPLKIGLAQNKFFERNTSEIPYHQLNVFEEVESEDEDEVHNNQEVCNELISSNQSLQLVHYTSAINRLFLKLASNNQHKVDLPFFILYHSWKSELV